MRARTRDMLMRGYGASSVSASSMSRGLPAIALNTMRSSTPAIGANTLPDPVL